MRNIIYSGNGEFAEIAQIKTADGYLGSFTYTSQIVQHGITPRAGDELWPEMSRGGWAKLKEYVEPKLKAIGLTLKIEGVHCYIVEA